jgi:hypothetical protein
MKRHRSRLSGGRRGLRIRDMSGEPEYEMNALYLSWICVHCRKSHRHREERKQLFK